jgi:hypothetical protein
MGAATGMPASTAGSGVGMPARTVGSSTGAATGMLAITGGNTGTGAGMAAAAGAGMLARTAGSGVGMPARTVGSSTVGAGTGGRGRVEGDRELRGSGGVGEVAIISVGVSDRFGVASVPTSVAGSAAVPNIGTSGCKGWLVVPVTTVVVALIMGVAAATVSATGAGAGEVGGT